MGSTIIQLTLAKKKDTTISQMTSLVMAPMACPNVSVFVTTLTVTAMKAQAPTGSGSRIRPRMVDAKMARQDQPYVTHA